MLGMKQRRNRDLQTFVFRESSAPAMTSQLYYPQSQILRGNRIVFHRKENLMLFYASNAGKKNWK